MKPVAIYFMLVGEGPLYLIMLFTGYCLALWLKPFLSKTLTAYLAGFLYSFITLVLYMVPWEMSGGFARGFAIACCFILIYRMDHRNMEQKIFLCAIFYVMRWQVAGVFSEVSFFLCDVTADIELFRVSIPAIMIEFAVQQIIWAGGNILFMCIAGNLLHRVYKRKYENMTWRELILMLVPAIAISMVKPLASAYYDLWSEGILNGTIQKNIPANGYRFAFYLLSYAAILVIVTFYQDIKSRQEEEQSLAILERQFDNNKRYVERVEALYADMRALRHDAGNHIMTIGHLVETGNKEEAVAYIRTLQEQFENVIPSVKTGNAVTDVIVSEYAKKAEEASVSFSNAYTFPRDVALSAFDVSVILNNALLNAMEEVKGKSGARIVLASYRKKNFYVIEVKNPIEKEVWIDEETGLPAYSKKGANHGYGLKNIKNVALRYQGGIDIRQERDEAGQLWFILDVMLQLGEAGSEKEASQKKESGVNDNKPEADIF